MNSKEEIKEAHRITSRKHGATTFISCDESICDGTINVKHPASCEHCALAYGNAIVGD